MSYVGEYRDALANRFGAAADSIVAPHPDYATSLAVVSNDAFFRCPTARMAHALATLGIPNYVYRFGLTVNTPFPALAGKAFHSAELPYVFGNSYLLGSVPPENVASSGLIMDYWTRFARTGDPNGGSAPNWPRYAPEAPLHLELASTVTSASNLREGCDFWDPIPISSP